MPYNRPDFDGALLKLTLFLKLRPPSRLVTQGKLPPPPALDTANVPRHLFPPGPRDNYLPYPVLWKLMGLVTIFLSLHKSNQIFDFVSRHRTPYHEIGG